MCSEQELVKRHITSNDDPENFIESLDAMFDDWCTYPGVCYGDEHRGTVVGHYRNLQQFLRALVVITPQGNKS
jgi:hypothetical protein